MHSIILSVTRIISRFTGVAVLLLTISVFLNPGTSLSESIDCLMCHEDLSKKKVAHLALDMGCPTCHSGIDASDIPHKKTNKSDKGLSSEQPDLCYTCHDMSRYTKKNVHAAIGMGCTGCHNPHSSDTEKLLASELPVLCFNCHDSSKFNGKTVHPPVTAGMCTGCHSPHSSDSGKLLLSAPPELCFNCHDKTAFTNKKTPHVPVSSGMCITCHEYHAGNTEKLLAKPVFELCTSCHTEQASGKHALGGLRGTHPIQGIADPSRNGRDISCISCHSPHGSDVTKLFVQKGICKLCHKY